MSVINFYKEAEKLVEKEQKIIVEADDFDVEILEGEGRLHTCGKDEFFYVLQGEGKLLVEEKLFTLQKGEGLLIKAGEKHKRVNPRVCYLMVTKNPHAHVFFDE